MADEERYASRAQTAVTPLHAALLTICLRTPLGPHTPRDPPMGSIDVESVEEEEARKEKDRADGRARHVANVAQLHRDCACCGEKNQDCGTCLGSGNWLTGSQRIQVLAEVQKYEKLEMSSGRAGELPAREHYREERERTAQKVREQRVRGQTARDGPESARRDVNIDLNSPGTFASCRCAKCSSTSITNDRESDHGGSHWFVVAYEICRLDIDADGDAIMTDQAEAEADGDVAMAEDVAAADDDAMVD